MTLALAVVAVVAVVALAVVIVALAYLCAPHIEWLIILDGAAAIIVGVLLLVHLIGKQNAEGMILPALAVLFLWWIGRPATWGQTAGPPADYRSAAYKNEFARVRRDVLDRDGHRCRVCGSPYNLHVHHRIERRYGGSNDPSNLVTLCHRHHQQVHGRRF